MPRLIFPMLLALLLAGCGNGPGPKADFGQRIVHADAEPQNWLSTGRTYGEERYSPLDQVNDETIGRLSLVWSHDLDTTHGQEATPIAVDGKLFTTSAWSKVQAFDAVTGKLLWQYDPEVPGATAVKACCDVVNRGVAYWDGRVFVGTLDGRLISLDADTGRMLWTVMTVDPALSYTITGAPRIVKGRVIIGNGGGELGARGYVSAYDAATGAKVWRFYTVPGEPGKVDGEVSDKPLAERAAKGWNGKWWTAEGGRGGGTVWDSMAYDPDLDLLYVGVGNSSVWNKAYRSPGDGDNLFVASILALRPETGEYVWHYQATPGDKWDYTSTQHMILTTLKIGGADRKVLMQAPKNGYFYILDRATGKLISAEPYISLNWSDGIDLATGRPRIKPEAHYDITGKPWIAMPGSMGGHNWQPMSYSPETGLVYIPAHEIGGLYRTDPAYTPRAIGPNVGIDINGLSLPDDQAVKAAVMQSIKGYLLAWDPIAQKAAWRAPNPGFLNGGVLSTAGNLVFQGDMDGRFNAYDARSGKKLWSFDAQSTILAAPISFSVKGRQYVSVVVGFGGAIGTFGGEISWRDGTPRINRSRVLTFALDGKGPPLPAIVREDVATPTPPEQFADAATISRGEYFYLNNCLTCHGGLARSAGLNPDLRRSAIIGDRHSFHAVVGEGILAERGMVGFAKVYSPAEIEAIRAYIISRARKDFSAR